MNYVKEKKSWWYVKDPIQCGHKCRGMNQIYVCTSIGVLERMCTRKKGEIIDSPMIIYADSVY